MRTFAAEFTSLNVLGIALKISIFLFFLFFLVIFYLCDRICTH